MGHGRAVACADTLVWSRHRFARFLLPIASVICNDTAAYFTGMLFGRTPLTQLSPKKTWEGFVGGLLATLVITVLVRAPGQHAPLRA